MIDIDNALRCASERGPSAWGEDRAVQVASEIAGHVGRSIDYEPPDEEWIRFTGEADIGMLSVRVPLALVTEGLAHLVHEVATDVFVVKISGFIDENLRGSPELIKATVLPFGWNDDFDTEAFSANDLFVESV